MQDLVVILGGAGGFAAAMRAVQLGGKVTVVEDAHYPSLGEALLDAAMDVERRSIHMPRW